MTERTQKLLDEVLALPSDEREDFVNRLLDSQASEHGGFASAELAKEWESEIARRLEEVDSRKVKAIPWEEVRRRMTSGDGPTS